MYTIIILPILFVIIRIYYLYKEDYFDSFEIFMFSILNALTSFLISCFVALIIPTKTEIVKSTFELESLQDGNSINGRFF